MGNLSQRNILWIVPILIIVGFSFFLGSKEEITDHEFITYIKESKLNDSEKNLELAFNEHCEDGKWVYFQTSFRQNVVEFKGACPVKGEKNSNINLQFIVDKKLKDYIVGTMLLDGEQISDEERDAFLSKILSSTNEIATP